MTDLEWLKLDPASRGETYPTWSPDGSQFTSIVEKTGRRQLAIASADGSDPVRLVGPQADNRAAFDTTWSPDGKTMALAVHPSVGDSTFWSIDVASGEATQLQSSKAGTWQRLAP